MTTEIADGAGAEANEKGWRGFVTKNGILKGSFAAILGAILTLLGTWYFTKNPHLTYTDGQVVTFKGEKNKFGIATCWIENDGDKEIEGIECVINTHGAKFNEVKVLPDTLSHAIASKNGSTRITAPLLNASEKLTISILLENTTDLPEQLELSVRGKGVIGSKQKSGPPLWRSILNIIFGLIVGSVLSFASEIFDWILGTDLSSRSLKKLLAVEKKENAGLKMLIEAYKLREKDTLKKQNT